MMRVSNKQLLCVVLCVGLLACVSCQSYPFLDVKTVDYFKPNVVGPKPVTPLDTSDLASAEDIKSETVDVPYEGPTAADARVVLEEELKSAPGFQAEAAYTPKLCGCICRASSSSSKLGFRLCFSSY